MSINDSKKTSARLLSQNIHAYFFRCGFLSPTVDEFLKIIVESSNVTNNASGAVSNEEFSLGNYKETQLRIMEFVSL